MYCVRYDQVTAVMFVRLQNKVRSIPVDEFEQTIPLAFGRGPSVGNTSRPTARYDLSLPFAGGKPISAQLVREDLKHHFLVHDFASERIH